MTNQSRVICSLVKKQHQDTLHVEVLIVKARARFVDMGLTGFSTHSSRRWVINKLGKTIKIEIIADIMEMNIATVKRYLDRDDDACGLAVASLSV